jgi:hypothetical protein
LDPADPSHIRATTIDFSVDTHLAEDACGQRTRQEHNGSASRRGNRYQWLRRTNEKGRLVDTTADMAVCVRQAMPPHSPRRKPQNQMSVS